VVERALTFRRVTEADHAALIEVFDDWWDERPKPKLERLWFRHWASTSEIAAASEGRRAALLIGFVSPDVPAEAVIRLVAVAPWARRRGIGRALVERFAATAAERGASRLVANAKPGDPAAIGFLRALRFIAVTSPETRLLYGVPALPDAGGRGEDLALFERTGVQPTGGRSSA
jgi:ribosomal protein S18 acetylase RimI-like enzyme